MLFRIQYASRVNEILRSSLGFGGVLRTVACIFGFRFFVCNTAFVPRHSLAWTLLKSSKRVILEPDHRPPPEIQSIGGSFSGTTPEGRSQSYGRRK